MRVKYIFCLKSLQLIFTICYYMMEPCYTNVKTERSLQLLSGKKIPVVGLGTHGLNHKKLQNTLTAALELGYRHIDTAFIYQNEEAIGKTLKEWFAKGGKREDLFITSKLPYFGNDPLLVEKYLVKSLERLSLQYVDLYLIHTPFGVILKNSTTTYDLAENEDGTVILNYPTNHVAMWKEMEKQVKMGRTKSIGLSNFNATQILSILKESEIKPSNLQIEIHLYHQQNPIVEFCRKLGIVVTGYAPLGSIGARKGLHPEQSEIDFPNPFKLSIVNEIAKKHNKLNNQVLLRHLVQKGLAIIPSTMNTDHLKSNIEIFDFNLTEEEMNSLNSLDKGDKGKIFDYKFLKGIEKHPQYPFDSGL